MNDTPILIVILAIAYVAGSLWANIWVTKHWPDNPFGKLVIILTAPACILILFTAAAFSLIIGPFLAAAHANRERKFAAAMKAVGRFKEWEEIKRSPSEGTVIIEQVQKDPCRVWWTPDDISEIAPHPIPEEEELDYLRIKEPRPFIKWCSERYTSGAAGQALLTELPFPIPPGFLTTEFLRTQVPITNVIAIVKLT